MHQLYAEQNNGNDLPWLIRSAMQGVACLCRKKCTLCTCRLASAAHRCWNYSIDICNKGISSNSLEQMARFHALKTFSCMRTDCPLTPMSSSVCSVFHVVCVVFRDAACSVAHTFFCLIQIGFINVDRTNKTRRLMHLYRSRVQGRHLQSCSIA